MASSRSTPSFHPAASSYLLSFCPAQILTSTDTKLRGIDRDSCTIVTHSCCFNTYIFVWVSSAGGHQHSLSPQMKDGGSATSRETPSAGWLAPCNHGIPLATAATSHEHKDMFKETLTHTHTKCPRCPLHTLSPHSWVRSERRKHMHVCIQCKSKKNIMESEREHLAVNKR